MCVIMSADSATSDKRTARPIDAKSTLNLLTYVAFQTVARERFNSENGHLNMSLKMDGSAWERSFGKSAIVALPLVNNSKFHYPIINFKYIKIKYNTYNNQKPKECFESYRMFPFVKKIPLRTLLQMKFCNWL